MIKEKTRFTADRRMFLKGAVAAGGAAALTVVSASGPADTDTEKNQAPGAVDKTTSKGYHETQHIKDFYRTLKT